MGLFDLCCFDLVFDSLIKLDIDAWFDVFHLFKEFDNWILMNIDGVINFSPDSMQNELSNYLFTPSGMQYK